MIIDIIFLVLIIMGVIKGFSRGFIVGVFSLLAFIVGLAAALKLSTVVAAYLKDSVNVSSKWLPVISFILVFVVVILLVRWIANLLQASIEVAMLGWLNRLGGIVLYVALYTIIFGVILFFAVQMKLVQEKTVKDSITYSAIAPVGPAVINNIGKIIPFFSEMFKELEDFFGNIAQKAGQYR